MLALTAGNPISAAIWVWYCNFFPQGEVCRPGLTARLPRLQAEVLSGKQEADWGQFRR